MAVVGIVLGVTMSASADPILRLVTFTVADPGKQDQAFQVVSDANKLFAAAKGFQSLKFSYDPATGQNVGVSLWDSLADMEAVTQTDAFKALLEKLKPLTLQRHLSASTKFAHVESRFFGRKRQGKVVFYPSANLCDGRACSVSVAVGVRGGLCTAAVEDLSHTTSKTGTPTICESHDRPPTLSGYHRAR